MCQWLPFPPDRDGPVLPRWVAPFFMGGPVLPVLPFFPVRWVAPFFLVGSGAASRCGRFAEGNGATHHLGWPCGSRFLLTAMAPFFPVRWVAPFFPCDGWPRSSVMGGPVLPVLPFFPAVDGPKDWGDYPGKSERGHRGYRGSSSQRFQSWKHARYIRASSVLLTRSQASNA